MTLRQARNVVLDAGRDRSDDKRVKLWVPSLSTLKDWSRRPGILPCLRESERVSLYDMSTIRKLVAEVRLRSA